MLARWDGASRADGIVSGRVEMPDVCSPSVSPAVVVLEPAEGASSFADRIEAGRRRADQSAGVAIRCRGCRRSPSGSPCGSPMPTPKRTTFTSSPPGTSLTSRWPPANRASSRRHGLAWCACRAISMRTCGDTWSSANSPWVQVCSVDGQFRSRMCRKAATRSSSGTRWETPSRRSVTVEAGKDLVDRADRAGCRPRRDSSDWGRGPRFEPGRT